MTDPFRLQRFLDAQTPVIESVLSELRRGHKQGHWMWFVFPQIHGLGSSSMAQRFAISSLAEAQAYLAHPVLGPRLLECTRLVNAVHGRSALDIFGPIDTLKFRSSMTLFAHATPGPGVFTHALDTFYNGQPDPLTLARL